MVCIHGGSFSLTGSGMLSASASIGMIMLWDVEMGLTQIDKFLYSTDNNIKVYIKLFVSLDLDIYLGRCLTWYRYC